MPAPTEAAEPAKSDKPTMLTGDLSGQLKWYYARLFPIKPFTQWLRYGRDETLARREVSFTLSGDIYLRFKSYASGEALLDALKQMAPIKMDLGAIYNFPPCDKASMTVPLTPVSKELVFDIDMTDYADVLGKQAGGSAEEETDRCWAIMATAVRVVDMALREDFGFSRIMWVYSGRRGVHCWVGDQRARRLGNEGRSAVAEFLTLRFDARENNGRRADVTTPLHPSLARATKCCAKTFKEFSLRKAGVMDDENGVRNVGMLIGGNRGSGMEIVDKVNRLGATSSAEEKWERMEKEIGKGGRGDWGVRGCGEYIVLAHSYPRLDVNVSKESNHLLKAPFCVHPKTGRVCVPFRASEVEEFSAGRDAPRLGELLGEMDKGGGEATKKLERGVEILEEFVREVEMETRENEKKERLEEVDRKAVMELMAH